MSGTGFWYSGQAAETKIDIALLSWFEAHGFGILGRQQNKNRYRITKLILVIGFWYSGQATKTKIDTALLSWF
jgi:uncharacterized membrane protein YfbV (UPF0208 family)